MISVFITANYKLQAEEGEGEQEEKWGRLIFIYSSSFIHYPKYIWKLLVSYVNSKY